MLFPFTTIVVGEFAVRCTGSTHRPFPAQFALSNLDGTNGFSLDGEATGDQCGFSISSAGDVNGDGIADFVIGANVADALGRPDAGKSYVVFGSRIIRSLLSSNGSINLSSLNGTNGFIINGEQAHDNSGLSVSGAGDVNGDGLDDIVIGAPHASPSGKSEAGRSYVVFGSRSFSSIVANGGFLDLSSLNGNIGFILSGESAGDTSGFSVSGAGDVNGDGVADFLIGAIRASSSANSATGKTYVVYGRKLSHSDSTPSTQTPSSLLLSSSSRTSMGQMKLTELTSTHYISQSPTIISMTELLNSFTHTAFSSHLTNDEQSIVLPLVLTFSGVFCLSGIVVYVIVFRKCNKDSEQDGNHELILEEPSAQLGQPNEIYQIIAKNPEYDVGNLD